MIYPPQNPTDVQELEPLQTLDLLEEEEEEEDYFDYYYDHPGSEPGTLSIEPDAKPSKIILIDYNAKHALRKINIPPHDCISYIEKDTVSWIDIQGLGSEALLKQVGEIFDLHPLLLEEVVNVPQRPKVEDYKQHLLVICQMVRSNPDKDGFETEQVGFVLGKNYLLTFQEDFITDCFDVVRDRIRTNQGKVRQEKADYLIYLLLDSLIDGYFPVAEDYEERIEAIEDDIIRNPTRQTMEELYHIRRELLALRRLIWPLRNVINLLMRDHSGFVSSEVQIYLRDCYDHVIQLWEIIEAYRELAASLMELYESAISNRMNEIMKFLTVISTIFIPLTFIAGIYGMNFENMPELHTKWGYYASLALMAAIAGGLIYFFWRQGWFKPTDVIRGR
ncbi:magnesium and cobalt transport protein CorA [Gloeothece citriformis PCC 7424]|uniref:Magnesium transport protein CorA n=1 Tax=Gloeothece citriformis (strain PCC 7424) TaxID=65393 RepID=B7KKV8_GLOC7|nr:magnesium/cobalt transporter CorA [Gloeothece citriformis]ACK71077.1 magnesium and cobalt transport protein CorA [Gloeothece citriformis PCC 7424]